MSTLTKQELEDICLVHVSETKKLRAELAEGFLIVEVLIKELDVCPFCEGSYEVGHEKTCRLRQWSEK
jgi:hypothetical protein